jgi:hypothetical protein
LGRTRLELDLIKNSTCLLLGISFWLGSISRCGIFGIRGSALLVSRVQAPTLFLVCWCVAKSLVQRIEAVSRSRTVGTGCACSGMRIVEFGQWHGPFDMPTTEHQCLSITGGRPDNFDRDCLIECHFAHSIAFRLWLGHLCNRCFAFALCVWHMSLSAAEESQKGAWIASCFVYRRAG